MLHDLTPPTVGEQTMAALVVESIQTGVSVERLMNEHARARFCGQPVSPDVRAASWHETERRHRHSSDEDEWGDAA